MMGPCFTDGSSTKTPSTCQYFRIKILPSNLPITSVPLPFSIPLPLSIPLSSVMTLVGAGVGVGADVGVKRSVLLPLVDAKVACVVDR